MKVTVGGYTGDLVSYSLSDLPFDKEPLVNVILKLGHNMYLHVYNVEQCEIKVETQL